MQVGTYHISHTSDDHIRSPLITDMAKSACCMFTHKLTSRLRQFSSVANISQLRRVQNLLAQVVKCTTRVEHIHPVLENSHWLPVSTTVSTTKWRSVHLSIENGQQALRFNFFLLLTNICHAVRLKRSSH
jgi:hypothetical protein